MADFKTAIEQASTEGNDADARALRAELKKAEAALKRSKTKDYYKILGEWGAIFSSQWPLREQHRRCSEGLLGIRDQERIPQREPQAPSRQGLSPPPNIESRS